MQSWRVDELLELAAVLSQAGLHSFVAQRTLQRLERGEISVERAIHPLSGETRTINIAPVDGN